MSSSLYDKSVGQGTKHGRLNNINTVRVHKYSQAIVTYSSGPNLGIVGYK